MNPLLLKKTGSMGPVPHAEDDDMEILGEELIAAIKAGSASDVVHCIKAMCMKMEASEDDYES